MYKYRLFIFCLLQTQYNWKVCLIKSLNICRSAYSAERFTYWTSKDWTSNDRTSNDRTSKDPTSNDWTSNDCGHSPGPQQWEGRVFELFMLSGSVPDQQAFQTANIIWWQWCSSCVIADSCSIISISQKNYVVFSCSTLTCLITFDALWRRIKG